jgi:thiamine kinase
LAGDEQQRLLASLPTPWRGGRLEPLGLGLTNCNYRLRLPSGRSYFLRQGHPEPARLGIDRATEWRLYRGAMAAGLALPCHYGDPERGILLLDWCEAPSWAQAPLPPSLALPALARLLARLHQLPLPTVRMAVRAHARGYRERLKAPPGWLDKLEAPLLASREPDGCWLPCHHDLNPANLLGEQPWVIDWEYGAAGHPGFELASIVRTHGWGLEEMAALEACYLEEIERLGQGRASGPLDFQGAAFLPWVDYIALLWAQLMAEQTPDAAYADLVAHHRQRLE